MEYFVITFCMSSNSITVDMDYVGGKLVKIWFNMWVKNNGNKMLFPDMSVNRLILVWSGDTLRVWLKIAEIM